jgi:hypothetical protein
MDGSINGLIAGGSAAILVFLGGIAILFSDTYQVTLQPYRLFLWLVFLSVLTVGQTVLSGFLVWTLMAAPSQEDLTAVQQK